MRVRHTPLHPRACAGALQVESPVFQELPRLPAPLGSFVHTSRLFRALPLADRASAVGLVGPLLQHDLNDDTYRWPASACTQWLPCIHARQRQQLTVRLAAVLLLTHCLQRTHALAAVFASLHHPPHAMRIYGNRQCDAMSAHELFASCGVTKRLYDEFLSPMLLVTLFAPPTQLSAAASLGACGGHVRCSCYSSCHPRHGCAHWHSLPLSCMRAAACLLTCMHRRRAVLLCPGSPSRL